MSQTEDLRKAKQVKNDEYYTRLVDIENELSHYKDQFKDKIVFCNCDDPYESNFFKYFAINFKTLGLKKLITTCYAGSPVVTEQLSLFDVKGLIVKKEEPKPAYKLEITEIPDFNDDGAVDLTDVEFLIKNKKNTLTLLKENGDFRSDECIELLKESDIVVTNPPFSLFNEYITILLNHKKKFLILGNPNSVHYKTVFPSIKNNELWIGYKSMGSDMYFIIPESYQQELKKNNREGSGYKTIDGKIYGRSRAIWFTNLEVTKRKEKLILYKKYNKDDYYTYDNLDAIDVPRISDIPVDYYGKMGVPDNFLEFYNPNQFKILGLSAGDAAKEIGVTKNYRGRTDLAFTDEHGQHKCPYSRIVIIRNDKDGEENGKQ